MPERLFCCCHCPRPANQLAMPPEGCVRSKGVVALLPKSGSISRGVWSRWGLRTRRSTRRPHGARTALRADAEGRY
eukprot:1619017-Pyramimonas_sp.AAC.1